MIDMTNEDLRDEWRDEDLLDERRAMTSRARLEDDAVTWALVQVRGMGKLTWSRRMAALDAALASRLERA